jgi:UDP-glucose 4-epimerase
MKVLVTGGAGYIGTELVRRIADDPAVERLIVYDNLSREQFNLFFSPHPLPAKVEFVQGELLDSRTLRKVVSEVDTVIHLAAKVSTPFADQSPHLFEQTNHWGTAELVYAAEETELERFIHVSSISVLGASKEVMNDERTPNPRTFYGTSKLRGEEHVRRLGEKMPVHILRCGNVYGYSKSMRFDAVINKFMFHAHMKGRIRIQGDGEQHRSFVHIDKVGDLFASMLQDRFEPGTYHMVDRILSINDIADTLEKLYEGLEKLYVNQHLRLREIKVKPSPAIESFLGPYEESLEDELKAFRKAFAFPPYSEEAVS